VTYPRHRRIRRAGLWAVATVSALVGLANSSSEPPEGVEFGRQDRNKWRVTVGPAFNFNLQSRLGFKSGRAVGVVSGVAVPQAATDARQAALDRITGASDPNGVKRYEGGAWIDPRDSAGIAGETWNFSVPSAADLIRGGQMTLSSASYVMTSVSSVATEGSASSSDDFNTPGVNIEVSRELYYNEKWRCGIDLSLGFSWFMRNDCFGAQGEIYRREDTTTTTTGHFTETFDVSDMVDPDGDYPFHQGILGNGTFAGPGPVLKFPGNIVAHETFSSRKDVHSVWAEASGDYNEFEFVAALRPYYEPWDWLRIYGTFGVGLSYLRLSYRESMAYDGVGVWSARNVENDFDVYGVAGLGGQLNYKHFLLGVDFLARLWASDAEIDSELLRGSISRGTWMFRCYIGFEF